VVVNVADYTFPSIPTSFSVGDTIRFICTQTVQILDTSKLGRIKIQCYGGKGVSGGGYEGGYGGYAYGELDCESYRSKFNKLYVLVGGQGLSGNSGGGGSGWYGGSLGDGAAGGSSYVSGNVGCPYQNPYGIKLENSSTISTMNAGDGYILITILSNPIEYTKPLCVGIDGISRLATDLYIGVNGVARKAAKAYIGVNGVAKQIWPPMEKGIPSPIITTNSLPSAYTETSYTTQLVASAGDGTYTWSGIGIPNGLSINPTTGILSGIATAPGNYNISITVTSGGKNTSKSFPFTVVLM
jgi:hypothetical protein